VRPGHYDGAGQLQVRRSTTTPMFTFTSTLSAICPDLLSLDEIGAADNLRGRVVRAFFWLMRFWPT
jgi:hypothetical protein